MTRLSISKAALAQMSEQRAEECVASLKRAASCGKAPPARLVGRPGPGERVCGKCRGNGLLNKRVASYPGWAMCGACDGTGVVPESKGRSRAARNIITEGHGKGPGQQPKGSTP